MKVSRISRANAIQIIEGNLPETHEVVIKFYGSNCHLCHALKPHFVQLASETEGVYFYAFNMDDGEGFENRYGFSGVPSICFVRTGGKKPYVRFLKDPANPHPETWFTSDEIKSFIKEQRSKSA